MKIFNISFQYIFTALALVIILCNIGSVVISQKGKFISSDYWQRYPALKQAYYNSIYANKKGTWLPDETLYAFNGGALITGVSPILVNPEVPPVGKYMIGLSAIVFNNEDIIILITLCISLVLLYLVGVQVLSSKLFAVIPVVLLSFEPIFLNQLIYSPLLDIIQLMFLLAAIYFFNSVFNNKKNAILFFGLSNICLGLFIGTKFYATGVPVALAFLSVLLVRKDIYLVKMFLITLPLAIFVLLFSYIRVLILGYPFMKFLGIQKWILWYNEGHVRTLFSVWPLLLFNRWYQSWNASKVLFDPQWRITWPIITTISLVMIIIEFFKKFHSKPELEVLLVWVTFYLIFLSFGDASARYFVILIPILYLIALYGIRSISIQFIKKFKKL